MKPLYLSVLTLILAGVVSYATTKAVQPTILSDEATVVEKTANKKTGESAYDRVMRTGTIRCGYALWPPFMNKNPNTGQLSGFNFDIFSDIGTELGFKIEWVEEAGFGNYIEGLKTKRYDAMCQTVWPDSARFKNSLVTLPAHYHKVHIVTRAGDVRFDKDWRILNDSQYRASVVDGDITDTIARTYFPKAQLVSLPQAADARQMFTEIETGKADATFVDYGFYLDYDRQNPGKLKIAGDVFKVYGSVFSVNNGELMLKNLLDNAIIALTNSGRIEQILRQHPTTAMSPAPTYLPLSLDVETQLKQGQ